MRRKFASCAIEIDKNGSKNGKDVQLFPVGEFAARDGRPGPGKVWRMTERAARSVMDLAARRKNDFLIDYEHQTLSAKENGREAPAAGWFSKLEWRPDKGLYAADVIWTAAAQARIDAGEYRYISPVFSYGADGTVLELLMAGLTNNPAIDGMDAVAAATFSIAREGEEEQMEALLKLLGLPEDADIDAVTEAVTALKEALAAAEAKTAAAKMEVPDPAKYAPVAALTGLRDEVAALRSQIQATEVGGIVAAALSDGRLLPAMEGWARDLGAKDIASLKAYIDKAQPIAALTGTQTGGKAPAGGDGALSDEALAVCKQMGVKPDDYKKTLNAA